MTGRSATHQSEKPHLQNETEVARGAISDSCTCSPWLAASWQRE